MADSGLELLEPPAHAIALEASGQAADAEPAEVVAADLLVEEISIDGMCGVY